MHTYICSKCSERYRASEIMYLCPVDDGVLDIDIDYLNIVRNGWRPERMSPADMSIWRYSMLIPVSKPDFKSGIVGSVGGSPLVYADQLSKGLGEQVWIKNDSLLPTGSLKDRASAVVVSDAIARGRNVIIAASTGNAGVALAGMAAATGVKAVILAPAGAPAGKIAQIVAYGALLILVDGSYSDAYDLASRASKEMNIYCRNTGYNPFTIEGKKTVAYEICEQLSDHLVDGDHANYWKVPDIVVVPVGDGNMISGVYKGFVDLMAIGITSKIPKIVGVQAEGSAAIANAYNRGDEVVAEVRSQTIADSISADRPSDGYRAIKAVKGSDGEYFTVAEDEIRKSVLDVASMTGMFVEESSAVVYSGLRQLQNTERVKSGDNVVILITGHGLKTVDGSGVNREMYSCVRPRLDELGDVLMSKNIIV